MSHVYDPEYDQGEAEIAQGTGLTNQEIHDWFEGGDTYTETHLAIQKFLDLDDEEMGILDARLELVDFVLEVIRSRKQ